MDVQKPFDVADLVQPDIFLPSQHLDRNKPRDRSPHRVLAAAILDLSLADLKILRPTRRKGGGRPAVLNGGLGNGALVARKSRNYQDAFEWVTDVRDTSLFGFTSCCELIGADAVRFRSGILELLRRREAALLRQREAA